MGISLYVSWYWIFDIRQYKGSTGSGGGEEVCPCQASCQHVTRALFFLCGKRKRKFYEREHGRNHNPFFHLPRTLFKLLALLCPRAKKEDQTSCLAVCECQIPGSLLPSNVLIFLRFLTKNSTNEENSPTLIMDHSSFHFLHQARFYLPGGCFIV